MTNQCFWCYKVWDGELPTNCPRCGEAVSDITTQTLGELVDKAKTKGEELSLVIKPLATVRIEDDEAEDRMTRLVRELEDRDAPEDVLDELVIDCFCRGASVVNNGGFDAQVEYLLANGYSDEDILGPLLPES